MNGKAIANHFTPTKTVIADADERSRRFRNRVA
jgi:hypothetical protein